MKILLIHNVYSNTGGEDLRVLETARLIREGDHIVVGCFRKSASVDGLFPRFLVGLEMFFSLRSFVDVFRIVKHERPDVACVFNVFPLLSPSVYVALWMVKVPVVQMVANYRLLYSFRDVACAVKQLIARKSLRSALVDCGYHSVYDVVYGLIVALNKPFGVFERILKYVVSSEHVKQRLTQSGINPDKIAIIPNFLLSQKVQKHTKKHKNYSIVYAGRLSYEKGVDVLFSALNGKHGEQILVVGDGPERKSLESLARKKQFPITFFGKLTHKETLDILTCCHVCVVPSRWSEPFGNIILDAMSCGVLVVASRVGGIPEIIQDRKNGLLFHSEDSNDLRKKILWAARHPQEVKKIITAATNDLKRYDAKKYVASLVSVFHEAMIHS